MGERFLQLDVFASRAGGGNPLGVVIGAEQWPDAAMQGCWSVSRGILAP